MKICFRYTNNSRKRYHLPLHRKWNNKKRYYTRKKVWEDFSAWYDAMNS